MLAAGRSAEVLKVLDAVPEKARDTTSYTNLRCAALLARGDVAGAKVAAERAVKLSNNDHAALANLAVVLLYEPSTNSALHE